MYGRQASRCVALFAVLLCCLPILCETGSDAEILARFGSNISQATDEFPSKVYESLRSIESFIQTKWAVCKYKRACRLGVLGVAGAATASAALLVIPSLLSISFGFSAMGPVAGSLAATYQSTYGSTATFSFLQSVAMGGIDPQTLAYVSGFGSMATMVMWGPSPAKAQEQQQQTQQEQQI